MPTFRVRNDAYYKDGERYEAGDLIELSEDEVDGLEFKVDRVDDDATPEPTTEPEPESATESEPEDETTDEDADDDGSGFDAEAFVDRTPVGDVADDIQHGEADGHLDAVEQAEAEGRDRDTVADAIQLRRDELNGGVTPG